MVLHEYNQYSQVLPSIGNSCICRNVDGKWLKYYIHIKDTSQDDCKKSSAAFCGKPGSVVDHGLWR